MKGCVGVESVSLKNIIVPFLPNMPNNKESRECFWYFGGYPKVKQKGHRGGGCLSNQGLDVNSKIVEWRGKLWRDDQWFHIECGKEGMNRREEFSIGEGLGELQYYYYDIIATKK